MKKEFLGELTIFLSSIFFAIVALLVKMVPGNFNAFFIALFRFGIGIIMGFSILYISRKKFVVKDKIDWALRGVFGAAAMILYYYSIQINAPGRATLFNVSYPIFVAIYSFLFFKDKVTKLNIVSILIAFVGVFLVFSDGSEYSLLGDILGLLSGMCAGFAVHYIKRARERNNTVIIYLSFCLFGMIPAIFSAGQFSDISISPLIILILIAVSAYIAQMLMTYGFKHVSATKGAITSLSRVPIAILFGFFIGEELTVRFFIGTVLILVGIAISRK